jgi:hypothetical protein
MPKGVSIPLDSPAWAERAPLHTIVEAGHHQTALILPQFVEPFPLDRDLSLADLMRTRQRAHTRALGGLYGALQEYSCRR